MNEAEKRALLFVLVSGLVGSFLLFLGRWGLHRKPLSPERFPRTQETYIRRLNINEASAAELEALPGIGPGLARKIVQKREERHGFRSIQELLKVEGIGEKRLEAIRPLVYVE